MPFINEHAARQSDPSRFKTFRRSDKGFPRGISVIIGIKPDRKSEVQSVRFDRKLWTVARAKRWLREHGFKTGGFERAIQKALNWAGIL